MNNVLPQLHANFNPNNPLNRNREVTFTLMRSEYECWEELVRVEPVEFATFALHLSECEWSRNRFGEYTYCVVSTTPREYHRFIERFF